jgi:hypothetical protein
VNGRKQNGEGVQKKQTLAIAIIKGCKKYFERKNYREKFKENREN